MIDIKQKIQIQPIVQVKNWHLRKDIQVPVIVDFLYRQILDSGIAEHYFIYYRKGYQLAEYQPEMHALINSEQYRLYDLVDAVPKILYRILRDLSLVLRNSDKSHAIHNVVFNFRDYTDWLETNNLCHQNDNLQKWAIHQHSLYGEEPFIEFLKEDFVDHANYFDNLSFAEKADRYDPDKTLPVFSCTERTAFYRQKALETKLRLHEKQMSGELSIPGVPFPHRSIPSVESESENPIEAARKKLEASLKKFVPDAAEVERAAIKSNLKKLYPSLSISPRNFEPVRKIDEEEMPDFLEKDREKLYRHSRRI